MVYISSVNINQGVVFLSPTTWESLSFHCHLGNSPPCPNIRCDNGWSMKSVLKSTNRIPLFLLHEITRCTVDIRIGRRVYRKPNMVLTTLPHQQWVSLVPPSSSEWAPAHAWNGTLIHVHSHHQGLNSYQSDKHINILTKVTGSMVR